MKLKKRRKSGRHAGSQTHGRGAKERTRGSGNQGGKGWAGTGKRADQKKTLVIHLFGNSYFGKDKTLRRGRSAPKLKTMNLSELQTRLPRLLAAKKASDNKGVYTIDLNGYKLLGDGDFSLKAQITASAASASAIAKAEKAGGKVVIVGEKAKKIEGSEGKG
jgi:large subunit ribosomal protein L15